MEIKLCECGCGNPVTKKANRFIIGHNISKPVKMLTVECECCGEKKEIYPSALNQFKYCSRSCAGKVMREQTTLENGNSFVNHYGYKVIKAKGHIMADNRDWVLEHRMIMSNKLGRKLTPNEHVHHINGDKLDNRSENLMLLSASDHLRKHAIERNFGEYGKERHRGRNEKGQFI